jgi:hypothetical protein
VTSGKLANESGSSRLEPRSIPCIEPLLRITEDLSREKICYVLAWPFGPAYGAVCDASNVPLEPGNELTLLSVVCVRGFARQPPIPDRATLVTKKMK